MERVKQIEVSDRPRGKEQLMDHFRKKYNIPENLTLADVLDLFYSNDLKAEARTAEWERTRKEDRQAWEKKLAEDRAEDDRKRAEDDRKRAEDDRKRAESRAAWEEKFERERAEWKESMRELNKSIGKVTNTFGAVIEHLVTAGAEASFAKIGLLLPETTRNRNACDEDGRIIAELDMTLENKDTVMVVETKSKPSPDDIKAQVEKMEKLRPWFDRRMPGKRILCAIAGAVFGSSQRLEALRAGFFVIVQSGETVKVDVPEGFVPRSW